MKTTTRKRIFVPWHEYGELALADYAASQTDGDCLPADAREQRTGSGAVVVILANSECGELARYRPILDHEGQPRVRRIRHDREVM